MRGPNLTALYEEQRPGRCCVCDARLEGSKKRLCGDAECIRVHRAAHNADKWLREKQRPEALARRRLSRQAYYQAVKANPEKAAIRRAQQQAWADAHPRKWKPGSHLRRAA